MTVANRFRHHALFYGGDDEYLAGTVPFIRERLDHSVLEAARASHSIVCLHGREERSDSYGAGANGRPFVGPLAPAPPDAEAHRFDRDRIPALRRVVTELATRAGLGEQRVADFALAISELAANSVRHAGTIVRVRMRTG